MYFKNIVRLCSAGKLNSKYAKRLYSNRNILSLHDRGMIEEVFPSTSTDEIQQRLVNSPQCVYAGFDPTADSLHVGNLLILMKLLHWQRSGHQVIAVLGGATGQIGDPSHRKKERDEINSKILDQNLNSIKRNIQTIFNNHAKYFWIDEKSPLTPPIILNNLNWYKNVNIIEFVRGVGKYFRLGTMMGRSSVQSRLNSEGGMSFTEFSYQVFQAYDWLYLYNTYNCYFQVGGNDQIGNIMSGHDLIRKAAGTQVYGMALPLITAEGGKKFGKSVGNAVWLSADKSSPFTFYQFFIRTADADVEKYLKLFTFLPLNKIAVIMEQQKITPEKRIAQEILAEEVTRLVHGEAGLNSAKLASIVLYDNSVESLSQKTADEIISVFDSTQVTHLPVEPGMTVLDLAKKVKCFKHDRDAERIITAGGYYINHSKVTNVCEVLVPGIHILSNNITLVRVGKKNYHVVRWLM